jgi:hypothetical protein
VRPASVVIACRTFKDEPDVGVAEARLRRGITDAMKVRAVAVAVVVVVRRAPCCVSPHHQSNKTKQIAINNRHHVTNKKTSKTRPTSSCAGCPSRATCSTWAAASACRRGG